jgi:predicted O-methyltransferase YrrM
MHTFDYVLVDFFLTDKLLRPGGIVVIDDYSLPAIYKSLSENIGRDYKVFGA